MQIKIEMDKATRISLNHSMRKGRRVMSGNRVAGHIEGLIFEA